MARIALGMVALVLLAGGADACDVRAPEDFRDLHWLDEDTLVTNQGMLVGLFHLGNATFEPVTKAFPILSQEVLPHGRTFVVSPDGRFLAVTRGVGTPAEVDAQCEFVLGTVEVVDLLTRERRTFLEGAALALAATEEGLVVAHPTEPDLLLYPWENGTATPRRLGEPAGSGFPGAGAENATGARGPRFDARNVTHLTAEGGLVAAIETRQGAPRLFLFNLTTGRPHAAAVAYLPLPHTDPVAGLAFHPAGHRLAVAVAPAGRFSELYTVRIDPDTMALLAERRDAATASAVAWGSPGIALAVGRAVERIPDAAELQLSGGWGAPRQERPSLLAFGPDGATLAVGDSGRLHLFPAAGEGRTYLRNPAANASAPYQVEPHGSETTTPPLPGEVPAPALLLALLGVALAAVLRRRLPS
ncbi:MAG TPA: hypothetical protein VNZ52_11150 [Candidatus Thermoplasmatota archaeon]|nr:hypothetical protein [Candidatus Thermoplasmatota archaeon]